MGTSYGTLSHPIVCPFTLKTIGIYSLTFINLVKVFFATLTFQNLPLLRKIYLRMYRDLLWYLIWLYCVPIHLKNHWNLFSDIYYLCKRVFRNPHFPELATVWENLFENVQGPPMVPYLTLLEFIMTFIIHAKVPSAKRENLFENVQGPLVVGYLTPLCAHSL